MLRLRIAGKADDRALAADAFDDPRLRGHEESLGDIKAKVNLASSVLASFSMADSTALKRILARRQGQYGHFVLQACFEAAIGGFNNLFAKLIAVRSGDNMPIPPPLDFGSFVFGSKHLELAELPPIIEQQHPKFTIDDYSFAMENAMLRPSNQEYMSSNNLWSEWPTQLLDLRSQSGANYVPPQILVSHGAGRIFRDVFDGIEQYMGDKLSNNSGLLHALVIVLPDYRIRISEITASQQEVTVRLMKSEGLHDLRAHCLIDGPKGRRELFEPINGQDVVLKIGSPADQIHDFRLFVLGKDDGVLDSYEQTPVHHTGRVRWLSGLQEGSAENTPDLLTEIRKGEGTNLEFKPFVHVGKDGKTDELVRAAIAFANTSGGTILLGISNTGEINGIERELLQASKNPDIAAAAEEYGRRFRTMLNDVTSVRLDTEVQVVRVANHTLLRIDVKELPFDNKPVWRQDTKETWVRRGSTNFKPDPGMIRDDFARKQEPEFPWES